ncbi:MAG: thioredoxin fold domain-containing protein [Bacteroidetes bacterium]|nr:thioredoxin fold domain-containing protein [Bacteroidota bacterium]
MKKIILFAAAILLAVGIFAFKPTQTKTVVDNSEITWVTDYDQAVADARDEGKEILLFFTGSDWCGWCKKLQADVLQKEAFVAYANENLICVELDFPKRTPLPQEIRQQNKSLQGKYGVRGYPSMRLLNADEELLYTLNGYIRGGEQALIQQLEPYVTAE